MSEKLQNAYFVIGRYPTPGLEHIARPEETYVVTPVQKNSHVVTPVQKNSHALLRAQTWSGMKLYTGVCGRENSAMTLKEMKPNEESLAGVEQVGIK